MHITLHSLKHALTGLLPGTREESAHVDGPYGEGGHHRRPESGFPSPFPREPWAQSWGSGSPLPPQELLYSLSSETHLLVSDQDLEREDDRRKLSESVADLSSSGTPQVLLPPYSARSSGSLEA